jgi:hypothetical protein
VNRCLIAAAGPSFQQSNATLRITSKSNTSVTLSELISMMQKKLQNTLSDVELTEIRVDATKSRLWIVSVDGKQILPATGSRMREIQVGRSQEVEVELLNNYEQQVEVGENEVRLEIDYGLSDNHPTLLLPLLLPSQLE